ncbi:T6SS immunity protein Tli4 family protein [Pseudomonas sp. BR1R-5]|uniref:T6SS immunity protein Tli4 family protein n=2 Tax=unclassified Pseudomonas TaxID=196821 RepID=UPI0024908BD2|nr:T6SS immunity protein Tli4 family protein [Pseudomonas sp. BR1R-5]
MLVHNNFYKRGLTALIGCGLLTALLISPIKSGATETMESPENLSKTVRVGRFSLDLPTDAVFSGALLELNGVPVSITPNYIKPRVEREAQKKWLSIESRNLNNAEHKATKEILGNGSLIYSYDHTRITGEGLDGEAINKIMHSTVAYQWSNNMMFVLGNDSTLNKEEQIRTILDSIESRDIYDHKSICYVNGCLPHKQGNEGVYVDFSFAEHPDLRAKFTSKQYGGAPNQPLSQRSSSSYSATDEAAWIIKSDFQHRTYRKTERAVNHLIGEEIIEASTEKSGEGYLTEINAVWYYPGVPNSDEKPELRFDLDYSYKTTRKPKNGAAFPGQDQPNSITEAQFMRIWNQALNSLTSI